MRQFQLQFLWLQSINGVRLKDVYGQIHRKVLQCILTGPQVLCTAWEKVPWRWSTTIPCPMIDPIFGHKMNRSDMMPGGYRMLQGYLIFGREYTAQHAQFSWSSSCCFPADDSGLVSDADGFCMWQLCLSLSFCKYGWLTMQNYGGILMSSDSDLPMFMLCCFNPAWLAETWWNHVHLGCARRCFDRSQASGFPADHRFFLHRICHKHKNRSMRKERRAVCKLSGSSRWVSLIHTIVHT
jgi:hypothetical protein